MPILHREMFSYLDIPFWEGISLPPTPFSRLKTPLWSATGIDESMSQYLAHTDQMFNKTGLHGSNEAQRKNIFQYHRWTESSTTPTIISRCIIQKFKFPVFIA